MSDVRTACFTGLRPAPASGFAPLSPRAREPTGDSGDLRGKEEALWSRLPSPQPMGFDTRRHKTRVQTASKMNRVCSRRAAQREGRFRAGRQEGGPRREAGGRLE